MAISANRNETGRGDVARIGLPGTILGVGPGGFVDGILLHQILQWHNMLTTRWPPTTGTSTGSTTSSRR